jgi:tRNA-specific 2-thiouridylase
MLATIDPRRLGRVWFPLGEQTKEETRAEALTADLSAAARPESQEACFLAGGDYRTFLGRQGLDARAGDLVDGSGAVVGRHSGFWQFTPGQRRGLGVAAAVPLYATAVDARRNTVTVGPHAALARTKVTVRGRLYDEVDRADVKLRYRSPAVSGAITGSSRGFRVSLDEPAYGVAPGQAAVLYDGDVIVGAGLVASASAE